MTLTTRFSGLDQRIICSGSGVACEVSLDWVQCPDCFTWRPGGLRTIAEHELRYFVGEHVIVVDPTLLDSIGWFDFNNSSDGISGEIVSVISPTTYRVLLNGDSWRELPSIHTIDAHHIQAKRTSAPNFVPSAWYPQTHNHASKTERIKHAKLAEASTTSAEINTAPDNP